MGQGGGLPRPALRRDRKWGDDRKDRGDNDKSEDDKKSSGISRLCGVAKLQSAQGTDDRQWGKNTTTPRVSDVSK